MVVWLMSREGAPPSSARAVVCGGYTLVLWLTVPRAQRASRRPAVCAAMVHVSSRLTPTRRCGGLGCRARGYTPFSPTPSTLRKKTAPHIRSVNGKRKDFTK